MSVGLSSRARRLLAHAYVAMFVGLIAYGAYNYIPVAMEYSKYWFTEYRLNPMDERLTHPLLVYSVERRGDQLLLRVFRTYVRPLARSLSLRVELCSAAGDCSFAFFQRRVATGCMYTFTIYLSPIEARIGEVVKVHVVALLNEQVVLDEEIYLEG